MFNDVIERNQQAMCASYAAVMMACTGRNTFILPGYLEFYPAEFFAGLVVNDAPVAAVIGGVQDMQNHPTLIDMIVQQHLIVWYCYGMLYPGAVLVVHSGADGKNKKSDPKDDHYCHKNDQIL